MVEKFRDLESNRSNCFWAPFASKFLETFNMFRLLTLLASFKNFEERRPFQNASLTLRRRLYCNLLFFRQVSFFPPGADWGRLRPQTHVVRERVHLVPNTTLYSLVSSARCLEDSYIRWLETRLSTQSPRSFELNLILGIIPAVHHRHSCRLSST